MNPEKPDLEIRLEGDAIDRASIPVSHVLTLFKSLTSVLEKVSQVNDVGDTATESTPREFNFRLVSLSEGSVAAVLGLDLNTLEPTLFEDRTEIGILRKAVSGLSQLQSTKEDIKLPAGYDNNVLEAWSKLKPMYENGLSTIQFTVKGENGSEITKASINKDDLARIQNRRVKKKTDLDTVEVEGKLLMVDLGKAGARLEIYPSIGKRIRCSFDDSLTYVVANNITRIVRVKGKAKVSGDSGEIHSVHAESVERVSDELEESTSAILERLIREQNISPATDLSRYEGTWPGELDDGFEELIDELRQHKPNLQD